MCHFNEKHLLAPLTAYACRNTEVLPHHKRASHEIKVWSELRVSHN